MAETQMIYRHLGRTGLKVSVLSYGAWVTFGNQVDVAQAKKLLQQCKDGGINFYDNAEVYADGKAEEVMGTAIKELGWKRSDYVISTKLFWGGKGVNDRGLSRKHLVEGIKASLERLGLEYVDLLFCHRPDTTTPVEETVRAMNWIIDQGYTFYWGTSEWSAAQITEAWAIADKLGLIGPAMEQPQYHMLERQKVEGDYAPLYASKGLGLTIWSPLASGLLTGKYSRDHVPPDSRLALEMYKGLREKKLVQANLDKVDGLKPIASDLGCSLAQLALAWCVKNEHVSTVIIGATKPEQIEDNFGCLAVVPKLTPEVMERIEKVIQSRPDAPSSFR